MGRILRSYNPLVYPGGRLPGIDPSHLAGPPLFSTVQIGGLPVNLIPLQAGTVSTPTPTASIDAIVGPIINTASGLDGAVDFTGGFSTSGSLGGAYQFTAAGIVIFPVSPGASDSFFLGCGATDGHGLKVGIDSTKFQWTNPGVALIDTTITYSLNVPYFVVYSYNGLVLNAVVLRLDTGQIASSSVSTSSTQIGSFDGTVTVGAQLPGGHGGSNVGCKVAATMFSKAYLSIPQMMQWAADPWSFWYPPTQRSSAQIRNPNFGLLTDTTRIQLPINAVEIGRQPYEVADTIIEYNPPNIRIVPRR